MGAERDYFDNVMWRPVFGKMRALLGRIMGDDVVAEEGEGGRAARVGAVREKRDHWRLEQALLVR